MVKLNRELAVNTTIHAIEEMKEFEYIFNRINDRATLGYNYVRVDGDGDLIEKLAKFSIKEYLEHLGFQISATQIKWRF